MDLKCSQKKYIINKIKKTNNWDMLDKIEEMFEEEQIYITDFIIDMFKKNYPTGTCEYLDHYHDPVIIEAFETDVRRIWLEVGNKLVSTNENIDHWSELYVKTKRYEEELDIWISEHNYLFNTYELCWVIFNIWCNKITFEK